MEANFAAAVGQLSHEDEESRLIVDSREILAAGARLVGAQLGEPEIDTYIALSGSYVEQGARDSGDVETTKGALTRTVYGRRVGGRDRSVIHKALVNLFRMELQFSGVDTHSGEFDTEFVALERLFVRLEFNRQIRYRESAPHRYDPALAGAEHDERSRHGSPSGTCARCSAATGSSSTGRSCAASVEPRSFYGSCCPRRGSPFPRAKTRLTSSSCGPP